jgi:DNA helicase-2/ATP-dependent DNA helicase PcrA
MPNIVADLHIHSHFSRATSQDLNLEQLSRWAQIKGVQVVATGDIAHPGWLTELKEKLEPAEEGLFRLKAEIAAAVQAEVPAACQGPVRFLLGGEVSNIYKKHGAVRKIHHLLFVPSLAAVERLQASLEKIGNIRADGRPILGLDSRNLLEIILATDPQGYLIPAHIWTPWFAILGSKSGFDTIEACFDDLTPHIFALETGLSSDPPMNWRISALDRYTLISNSDAHSPPKLAREATLFNTEFSYPALFAALHSGDPASFGGTLEFFPEEGKYHIDGHRNCGIRWEPETTAAHNAICPVCGKPVTVGVMNRVAALADRPPGARPVRTHPYENLIPLPEILGEVYGVGAGAKQVQQTYTALLGKLGPELTILRAVPPEEIARAGGVLLAEGIRRMRRGEVVIDAGYDGEYGVIKLFEAHERQVATNQISLFGEAGKRTPSAKKAPRSREEQADAVRPARWARVDPLDAGSAPADDAQAPKRVAEASAPDYVAPSADEDTVALVSPAVESLFAGLNPAQQAAVTEVERPLLIVAGPGTGKTRTLTHRIAYLIHGHGAAPAEILAITFTNKAAAEMQSRLAQLLGPVAGQLTIKTFHAFGAQLLHEHGALLGLPAEFVIASEADQLALLRKVMPAGRDRQSTATLEQISTAKNQLLAPDAVAQQDAEVGALYAAYEAELRRNQMVDFDDLLFLAVKLLSEHPATLQALQDRYRWLSVDEYQDINLAQARLLQLLAAGGANLCAIGDPDQAIYGFRGADRGYFLRFAEDFPGARQLQLLQNYRSTQPILDAALQVIAHNPDPGSRALQAIALDQTKLDIYAAPTDKAEAEYVVHQIEQLVGGTSLFSLDSGRVGGGETGERTFADFAVLYRLGAQSQALREAFERSGMPYQTVGETPLTEYKEVREIVAYLWLAHNPQAEHQRQLILEAAPKRLAASINHFVQGLSSIEVPRLIEQVRDFLVTTVGRTYDAHQTERVDRLIRRAVPFGARLGEFLEALALQNESDLYDPRADRVALMTLHAAKGLEFRVVFIVGCEETLLPYSQPGRTADVAEERRLFYVGLTRAQEKLVLTQAQTRLLYGQRMHNPPTRFLAEIAAALKEQRSQAARKAAKEQRELQQLSLFS